MRKFAEFIIKWRYPILIVIVSITIFFLYELRNIQINSDWSTYLKEEDPSIKLFHYVGEKFSGNVTAVVAIEAEDVFSYKVLSAIASMTNELKTVEGISSVTSLTEIIDIRNVDGVLEIRNLIDTDIPQDRVELDSLRKYVLSKDMYNGRIVSSDGRFTMIVCLLDPGADEETVARKIRGIADRYRDGIKIYYAGIPMQMLELSRIIKKDLYRLVPFTIVALVLMLYLNFGDFRSVFLPLLSVAISVIWCMGLMVVFGVKFSLVSNALPVVLMTVGSAYGIHIVAHFRELRKDVPDRRELIKSTLLHVGVPIFLAAITTVVGFVSFIGSYLTIITEFGIFSAIGVLIALAMSLILIPILLYSMFDKKISLKSSPLDRPVEKLLLFLKTVVLRRNKWIVVVAAVVVLVSIGGLPLLERDSNIMRYFKKDTEIRIAENLMKKYFGGSYTVQILVKGDMRHPAVLKKVVELEKYLNSIENVSKAQSIADYICEMNRVMNGLYVIPETKDGVANLYFFIESEPVVEQMVDKDYKEGLVQARIYTLDTGGIIKLVDAIDAYLRDTLNTRLVYAGRDVPGNGSFLDSFVIEQASREILYDLKEFGYVNESDVGKIRGEIKKALRERFYPYGSDWRVRLQARLEEFFLYESAIVVEDENLLGQLVRDFTELISRGGAPDLRSVRDIFRVRGIESRFDVEEVELTTETIQDIWEDFFNKVKVDFIAERLRKRFGFSEGNLYQNIVSDLWVLNEEMVLLPESVARKYGVQGELVNIEMSQTGSATIFKKLDESIVKSQVKSLIIAIGLVYILLMLQLRSFKGGVFALVPIVITVLFNFAMMAYTKVPLDTATVMIASIAIGIGIDYSIHFINRFKMEFSRHGSIEKILESTLLTTGKAILINALSVIAGFLVLVFGELAPIQRFGWLIALTMVISVFGALTVLPSLFISTRAKFVGDFSAVKLFNHNNRRRGGKK